MMTVKIYFEWIGVLKASDDVLIYILLIYQAWNKLVFLSSYPHDSKCFWDLPGQPIWILLPAFPLFRNTHERAKIKYLHIKCNTKYWTYEMLCDSFQYPFKLKNTGRSMHFFICEIKTLIFWIFRCVILILRLLKFNYVKYSSTIYCVFLCIICWYTYLT